MVVITFFGLLVGFSAPVQRAWLMGMLTIAAWLVGRRAHPLTSLAAASLIVDHRGESALAVEREFSAFLCRDGGTHLRRAHR